MNLMKFCRYCLSNLFFCFYYFLFYFSQDMEHFDGELRQCDASELENLSHSFTTPAHAEPRPSGGEIRLSIHSSSSPFSHYRQSSHCACVYFRGRRSMILMCLMTRSLEIRWTCTPSSSHVWTRSRCSLQNRYSVYTPDLWDYLSDAIIIFIMILAIPFPWHSVC